MSKKLSEMLTDYPVDSIQIFGSYKDKRDKTKLPSNSLIKPSKNCFVPDNDKVVPRDGSKYIGETYSVVTSSNVGSFVVGDVVTGSQTGATAIVTKVSTNLLECTNLNKEFTENETITGSISIATGILVSTELIAPLYNIVGEKENFKNINGDTLQIRVSKSGDNSLKDIVEVLYKNTATQALKWWQVTENNNPIPAGAHEYYFGEWYDTNLGGVSLNINRLVFVNGYQNQSTKKGLICSWSGAITTIVGVTSTTISVGSTKTWREYGFVENASNQCKIIVNGVSYIVTNNADLNTSTVNVTSTTGISANDVAIGAIETDEAPVPLDVCANTNAYMYYLDHSKQSYYQSNAFNRISSQSISNVQAVQNDIILSGSYTGTSVKKVRYQIDRVAQVPQFSTVLFTTSPYSQPDNLTWDYSNYTPSSRNVYVVKITGISPAPNRFTLYKNGTAVSGFVNVLAQEGVLLQLIDGLAITFADIPPLYYVQNSSWSITVGGLDTYSWYIDNVLQASNIDVNVALSYLGISAITNSPRGHSVGDFWEFTLNPAVIRGWASFYYSLLRSPGEGYIGRLPSNGWALASQEREMYVNTADGKWCTISTKLSSDLQSETVIVEQLKQSGSNKMIQPYMFGYLEDYLVYVNTDKTLDIIGRKKFIELPQIGTLSDDVRNGFLATSFTDGSIKYYKKRLYISSPNDNIMFCYDNIKKYWQPIQEIPECALLSLYEQSLIAHSNYRKVSSTIFDPNANGDNGKDYTVIASFAFNSYGNRFIKKTTNMATIEGNISGEPPIKMQVVSDINGSAMYEDFYVDTTKRMTAQSNASLGLGNIGSHNIGSDVPSGFDFFRSNKDIKSISFWFSSVGFSCTAKKHTYEILSLGINAILSQENNSKFRETAFINNDYIV